MIRTLRNTFWAIAFIVLAIMPCCTPKHQETSTDATSLKDAFSGMFTIGTALNASQIQGEDPVARQTILKHFNSIVAENCMKSALIQPQEGVFDFELPDAFVAFGQANNMEIIGHTLIWHSQAPKWLFVDETGKDVSREVLIERMRKHISTVVGRYKGKIHGWDVVNEAILDDGSWRNTKFYEIIGEDYVKLAFEFAQEADPDTELYYNDYSMAMPERRQGVVDMVKNLREQGVKIDGIGMQGHVNLDFPALEEFENSLLTFAGLGVKVMITEMDITVLPWPDRRVGADVSLNIEYNKELNPYPNGMPEDVAAQWHNRYLDFFKLFIKHRDKISRVTTWCTSDADSWRNDWPVRGRTDYPLLFDRDYQPKPVVEAIILEAQSAK